MKVTRAQLAQFHDAYAYDSVTPMSWLFRRLVTLRDAIENGEVIEIEDESNTCLATRDDFLRWAFMEFPGFENDPLHDLRGDFRD